MTLSIKWELIQAFAVSQGLRLQHLKPHGALYNMAVANPKIWDAIAEAVARIDREIIMVVLASSKKEPLFEIGKRCGIRIAFEAFPDRAYNREGSLVSRREKGAVIHDCACIIWCRWRKLCTAPCSRFLNR